MSWSPLIVKWLPTPLYQISTIGLLPFLIASERISPQNRNRLLTAMRSVTVKSAAWRLSLLNEFNLEEVPLHQISQPTLIVASVTDQLLPSVAEADKLVRCLPNARQVLLPKSGHACLLERDIRLKEILASRGFLTNNYGFKSSVSNDLSNMITQ